MCDLSVTLTFALEALSGETIHERAAVITKCKLHVVVDLESVRNVDLEPGPSALLADGVLEAGARRDDHLVAPLVDHAHAHLALVALLAQSPATNMIIISALSALKCCYSPNKVLAV